MTQVPLKWQQKEHCFCFLQSIECIVTIWVISLLCMIDDFEFKAYHCLCYVFYIIAAKWNTLSWYFVSFLYYKRFHFGSVYVTWDLFNTLIRCPERLGNNVCIDYLNTRAYTLLIKVPLPKPLSYPIECVG